MTQKNGYPQRLLVVAVLAAPTLFAAVNGTSRMGPVVRSQSAGVDRTARVLTPRRMPAETTLSVKAIRNVESPNWLQDLEIEVQNNFSQPVYFLGLHLLFPDLPRRHVEGVLRSQAVSLEYGRWQLMRPGEFATSADLPLKSGETHVFKIPESDREGFEEALAEMGVTKSLINNIEIRITFVSFGDGTGYRNGSPFSLNTSKRSRTLERGIALK